VTTAYDVVTEVAEQDNRTVFEVYEVVFGDRPDYAAWRREVWDRHVRRPGFRLARAVDEGRLVGFGYGYTGEPGQWWTDQAARALPPEVAQEWLGGHFEVVSIGVLPEVRGRGVGRAVMEALTDQLPHDRRLLMTTADEGDPARRLYRRLGWQVIGPGLRDDQVIMGRRR
jgi:ribosomal protein S18 acetylase RimI-like enzyme